MCAWLVCARSPSRSASLLALGRWADALAVVEGPVKSRAMGTGPTEGQVFASLEVVGVCTSHARFLTGLLSLSVVHE